MSEVLIDYESKTIHLNLQIGWRSGGTATGDPRTSHLKMSDFYSWATKELARDADDGKLALPFEGSFHEGPIYGWWAYSGFRIFPPEPIGWTDQTSYTCAGAERFYLPDYTRPLSRWEKLVEWVKDLIP